MSYLIINATTTSGKTEAKVETADTEITAVQLFHSYCSANLGKKADVTYRIIVINPDGNVIKSETYTGNAKE